MIDFLFSQEKNVHCPSESPFSSVQLNRSVVSKFCSPMNHSMPGLPVHHQLLESTHTHVHWVGDVIQPSHPLSSPSPPALNLSQHQGLFQWVSSSRQVAKVLEFFFFFFFNIVVSASTSVLPMNTQTELFMMDWLYLPAVHGILKSLLQYHSSKASILRLSAFFIVQLSHPYMNIG